MLYVHTYWVYLKQAHIFLTIAVKRICVYFWLTQYIIVYLCKFQLIKNRMKYEYYLHNVLVMKRFIIFINIVKKNICNASFNKINAENKEKWINVAISWPRYITGLVLNGDRQGLPVQAGVPGLEGLDTLEGRGVLHPLDRLPVAHEVDVLSLHLHQG